MNAGKFAIPGMMIVHFGSIGSSWFYGLEFNERYLTGMRWDSSAKDWGALITLAGDALQAEREDAHGDYAERGAETARDDFANCDSRGRSLRPAVNDAGEPWWM